MVDSRPAFGPNERDIAMRATKKDTPATAKPRRSRGRADRIALPMEATDVDPHGDADSDHLVISAAKQITIQCGESSITLTAAGKIILRGKYIVSRSSGMQRIKGGSVQIN